VGLGTGDSAGDSLFQAGSETDISTSGAATDYLWWELYPMNNQQQLDVRVYPGDTIFGHVEITTGLNQGTVTVCDESYSPAVCSMLGVSWSSPYVVTGAQAEWIAERTDVNGQYPLFTDLSNIQFGGSEALTNGSNQTWTPLDSINNQYLYMYPTCALQGQPMAEAGSIYSNDNWGLRWYDYGQVVKACSP